MLSKSNSVFIFLVWPPGSGEISFGYPTQLIVLRWEDFLSSKGPVGFFCEDRKNKGCLRDDLKIFGTSLENPRKTLETPRKTQEVRSFGAFSKKISEEGTTDVPRSAPRRSGETVRVVSGKRYVEGK